MADQSVNRFRTEMTSNGSRNVTGGKSQRQRDNASDSKGDGDMSKLVVLDAGGGAGRHNIQFETLADGQSAMYERTLNQLSDFQIAHLAQEKRQLTVVDTPISMYINVSREDFPDITARIDIVYIRSASSQAWAKLMKDICIQLKIDFIHSLLDRVDKSPVHRILRLRPGGDYLARQRETSAILEVINTGTTPIDVSWDITMDINNVKQSLAFDTRNMPVIDKRIANLVSKHMTRDTQRDITTLIMNAVSPKAAVGVIEQFHKQYIGINTNNNTNNTDNTEEDMSYGNITKYADAIDIVTLHRLCLETLSRFVIQGRAKHVATSPCFEYICNIIDGLRSEVDVVTIGLKLLSDVMKYLVEEREIVYHTILNCIQAYAPPEAKHRTRNPKRLLPPEEQMSMGFAVPFQNNNTVMGAREAVMPAHTSLQRYGDFYGHSTPFVGEVNQMTTDIKKADDVLNRFEIKNVSTVVVPSQQNNTTTVTPVVSDVQSTVDVMALVRGRVRIDHTAASQAMQTAFHAPLTSPTPHHAKTLPRPEVVVEDSTSNEFVQQQNEFKQKNKTARRAKYQFKFKTSSSGVDGVNSDGGDTGEENGRKQWKGTVGVIGRRAPEKVVEVVIDFKKKITYDHTQDSVEESVENTGVVGVQSIQGVQGDTTGINNTGINGINNIENNTIVVKTEQELTEEADRAAIASVLLASAAVKKKRRKHKFTIVPLPLVPCVQFRGLSGRSKQNMAMMQSFATLFKMISQSFGNRDIAFKMGVVEEISVIVTVCQAMPRVLDYFMWIVDSMYRDGFGEISADELDIALEDYTMVLSVDPSDLNTHTTAHPTTHPNTTTKDNMTGFQFDAISEMSIPSVDVDGLRSEVTPIVNIGVSIPEDQTTQAIQTERRISRRETANTVIGDTSKVGTDDAMDENVQIPSNQIKKAANQMLVNVLGLYEFEARYVTRPAECVVLAVAMISSHAELEVREKQMANRWLDVWDDRSRAFKLLKKKGMDLAGL